MLRIGKNVWWCNDMYGGEWFQTVAEIFLDHRGGERKENWGVRRLHENIRAHALYPLSPFGNHSRSETHNHENQNHLDGNGNHAEEGSQAPRRDIAPEHLQEGERPIEGLVRFWIPT